MPQKQQHQQLVRQGKQEDYLALKQVPQKQQEQLLQHQQLQQEQLTLQQQQERQHQQQKQFQPNQVRQGIEQQEHKQKQPEVELQQSPGQLVRHRSWFRSFRSKTVPRGRWRFRDQYLQRLFRISYS